MGIDSKTTRPLVTRPWYKIVAFYDDFSLTSRRFKPLGMLPVL